MKTFLPIAIAALTLSALVGCQQNASEPAVAAAPAPETPPSSAAPDAPGLFQPDPAKMEEAASIRSPILHHRAPDFTLMDEHDQPITLSKVPDPWIVLYFYPKDDTPGCACQATEFTKLLTDFHGMNAKVYGISSDSTGSHRAFIDKYHLKLDLLSDPDHAVMSAYGAWVQTRLGDQTYDRVIRSTVIVGPDRTIAWHWPEVIPEGHAKRVEMKLQELQRAAK